MTIKAKLLIITLLITVSIVITSGVFYYYQNKFVKLESLKTVVHIVKCDILELRKNEKDFITRLDKSYIEQYIKNYQQLKSHIKQAKDLSKELYLDYKYLDDLEINVQHYKKEFLIISDLYTEIGLSENLGLRGKMRNAIHSVEDSLVKYENDNLLVDILTLRRHEKDFLLRKNEKYLKKYNLKVLATTNKLRDDSKYDALINDLVIYQKSFRDLVESHRAIGFNENRAQNKVMQGVLDETFNSLENILKYTTTKTQQIKHNSVIVLGVIMSIEFLMIVIAIFLVIRNILSSLSNVTSQMQSVDLQKHLECTTKDETSQMINSINSFTFRVRDLVMELYASFNNTKKQGIVLSDTANYVTRSVKDQNAMIEKAKENIQKASSISLSAKQQSLKASDVMKLNISELKTLEDTIHSTSATVQINADKASQLVDDLKELSLQAQDSKSVLDSIKDIADQTNLLALNAAIEAARAGEHGRGFAVVADEVRKLAEKTQHSLGEVNVTLNTITNSIEQVGSNIEENAKYTHGISKDMDSTIDVISRVSSSIYKASSNVETVAEDVDGVVAFNQEVLEEIEYVTIVSIQNEEAAAKIEDITSQMHTNVLELEGLMKGFNVEIKEEVVTNNKNQENDVSFDLDGDDDFIMFD